MYGSLRVGEALATLLPKNPYRYNATATGTLCYAPNTRGYPVFTTHGDGKVQGELLWLDLEDPDVAYVIIMELESGYDIERIAVNMDDNIQANVEAVAFTWPYGKATGPTIAGGDWTNRDQSSNLSFVCRECGSVYGMEALRQQCEDDHKLDDYLKAVADGEV